MLIRIGEALEASECSKSLAVQLQTQELCCLLQVLIRLKILSVVEDDVDIRGPCPLENKTAAFISSCGL